MSTLVDQPEIQLHKIARSNSLVFDCGPGLDQEAP